jgi:hypothetical protein
MNSQNRCEAKRDDQASNPNIMRVGKYIVTSMPEYLCKAVLMSEKPGKKESRRAVWGFVPEMLGKSGLCMASCPKWAFLLRV